MQSPITLVLISTEILVSVKYLSPRAAVKNMYVFGYKIVGFTVKTAT